MSSAVEGKRMAVSVEEAAELLGIGRSSAYLAISRGEIPVVRIGRRTVVPVKGLEEFLSAATEGQVVTEGVASSKRSAA